MNFKGSKLDKKAGASADASSRGPSSNLAKFRVRDQDGNPVGYVRWSSTLPDGSVLHGLTDESGMATIPSPASGSIEVRLLDFDRELLKVS